MTYRFSNVLRHVNLRSDFFFCIKLDPNQQYYGGQPHPQAGFAPGYPPQGGYPPQQGFQQPGFQQPGYPPQPGFQQPGYGQPGGFGYGGQDAPYGNDDPKDGSQFEDASIRRGFIRKVYAILMVSHQSTDNS